MNKTIAKVALGAGAVLALGVGLYLLVRPKPPGHPEEEIGIHIDDAVLDDPTGQRRVMPGEDVNVTVFLTNIGEIDVSPRFRIPIWDGRSPIGDSDSDWTRAPLTSPGESASVTLTQTVPTNWPPGWAVSVRLDLEGVGPVKTWETYFDIVGVAQPEDIEIIGTTYFVA